ncbi:MAG: MopE-related protein [Acidobacteriota bacterium]
MRKLLAWLGLATLFLLPSSAPVQAAGATVLKPYIVLILDVSGSMQDPTGSGPPTCAGAQGQALADTKLNHARCAVQNIVNSYGDIVFAYARFHERAGTSSSTGQACGTNATSPTNCTLTQDACTENSDRFQLMTALVDGTNANTAAWSDFSCNTCQPSIPFGAGQDPEVWNALGSTPLEGALDGAKCYWMGQNASTTDGSCSATSGVVLWPSASAGFSPIVNDPTNGQFLPNSCDASPTCTTNCCATQCRPYIVIMLTDGDETCGGTEGHCSVTKSQTCNPVGGIGCPGGETCVYGPGSCSVTTTRSCYVNADCPGGETCNGAASVPAAAASMLRTDIAGKRYRILTKPIGFGTPTVPYGPIENMALAGGATAIPGKNAGFYASDEAGIELAMSQIIEGSIRSETCNNADDDCDGAVDEDFPTKGQPCTNGGNGVCLGTGVFVCTADGTGVTCDITNPGQPPQTTCPAGKTCNSDGSEVCGDSLDNDCDGFVDEGCTACVPTAEICNGKDDDCDGNVDEDVPDKQCGSGSCFPNTGCCGVEKCVGGSYGACSATWTPVPEVCNNIDDDCDGSIDEDLSNACSNITGNGCTTAPCPETNNPGDSKVYHCTGTKVACTGPTDTSCPGGVACVPPIPQNVCHPGQQSCSGGAEGACTGEVTPGTEICNGLDDDCDNIIDEDTGGGSCNATCGTGVILCAGSPAAPACGGAGQPACGTLYCSATSGGSDTTCNGMDEDCDGKVDEDWKCDDPTNQSNPAVGCACQTATICNGVNMCIGGSVQCVGTPIDPTSCCDCNGTPQNGSCSGGASCASNCECAYPCSGGEFPCPSGKKCDPGSNLCVNDPCFGVTCGSSAQGNAQTCIENQITHDGICVEDCSNHCSKTATMLCNGPNDTTSCPSGETCLPVTTCSTGLRCYPPTGACEVDDCTSDFPDRKCAANQSCVVDANTGMGQCVTNPCYGVTCPGNQYCEAGNCIDSCATVTCKAGERCQLGVCQPDPCGKPCPYGQVCNDATGACVDNPCAMRTCPTGQWCNPNDNQCEVDPCVGTSCPADPPGQICRGGTCYNAGMFSSDAGEQHVTVAGGGCSTGGGGAGLVVGLALMFVGRRRRARRGGAK